MNRIAKYGWLGLISARSNLAYIAEVGSRVIFLAIVLFIFLKLWQVTFAEMKTDLLGGLTLAQMLWYLMFTESITLSAPRVAYLVDQDVRTGSLAIQLLRPMSYPFYALSSTLGERLVRFVMNVMVGSAIAFCLVGPLHFTMQGLALVVVALPLAFVLDFLGNFAIGLGAFWLEDTTGLLLIYSRVTMILGGMLIPVELFPDYLQPLVRAMPFASIVYGPAHVFVKPDVPELSELLIRQGAAVLAFGLLVWLIYRLALRRVFANGG